MASFVTEVLLIEDDKLDVEAFKRAAKKSGASEKFSIAWVSNGEEAIEYLNECDRPKIILVDLNMPRMNGFEFISWIRSQPHLRDSVIFVLTSSDSPRDLKQAYSYNIAGYLVKGDYGTHLTEIVRMLDRFIQTVEFPGAG